MSLQEKSLYDFGSYRLDARERVLFLSGEVVPLAPESIDLLVALVENGGHVLSKDDLMKQVWPDSFVEEANLSHHIFVLRKALGEGDHGAIYIETIPRRGYRFVASVTRLNDTGSDHIAGALALELSGEDGRRLAKHYTENTEAYQLYARGLHFWNRFEADDFKKAIRFFEQAIEKDQEYALAYAGLAHAYNCDGANWGEHRTEETRAGIGPTIPRH